MNNLISRRFFVLQTFKVSLAWSLVISNYVKAGVFGTHTQVTLNFSDFGGIPEATPEKLLIAFDRAFEKLRIIGGGILQVLPGSYDLGKYATSQSIINIDDLKNVFISAYGASFRITSNASITPLLFCFHNPNNVVLAGASFIDLGFKKSAWLSHRRWGMFCVSVDSSYVCSNFKLVDCSAENVTGLFNIDSRSHKFKVKDVVIQDCKVTNAYYGVGALYHGDGLSIRNLVCEDVRRGFISYGSKNADVDIKLHCTANFFGSNGFISLACEGSNEGDVENIKIKLEVSGVESHTALVHFYHQQNASLGVIKNIQANVIVNQLTTDGKNTKLGNLNIFRFDHELPDTTVLKNTARIWDQIILSGKVTGKISGKLISVASEPNVQGVLALDENFYSQADLSSLVNKFMVKRQSNNII